MTMDDLRMLERAHENAVRDLQNLATNIVDFLMAGGEFTTMQQLAYREAKKKVMAIKADLARAMNEEFEDVLNG